MYMYMYMYMYFYSLVLIFLLLKFSSTLSSVVIMLCTNFSDFSEGSLKY